MAACHVLHRLLFLDKSCCFATESVIAISSMITDLYHDQYCGRILNCNEGIVERGAQGEDGALTSTCMDNSNEISGSQLPICPGDALGLVDCVRNDSTNKESRRVNKERSQVITPRWNRVATTATNDRIERRRQAIEAMSQRWGYKPQSTGTKRHRYETTDSDSTAALPLPGIGDVLAVNLLRLLEGTAAIRIHHRQHRLSIDLSDDRNYVMAKIASLTAAEILTEIRSTADLEITLPIHVDDVATFYYNETMSMRAGRNHGKSALLRPGAKVMLRLHLFELVKKLTLYEHV